MHTCKLVLNTRNRTFENIFMPNQGKKWTVQCIARRLVGQTPAQHPANLIVSRTSNVRPQLMLGQNRLTNSSYKCSVYILLQM